MSEQSLFPNHPPHPEFRQWFQDRTGVPADPLIEALFLSGAPIRLNTKTLKNGSRKLKSMFVGGCLPKS